MPDPSRSTSLDTASRILDKATIVPESEACSHASIYVRDSDKFDGINFLQGATNREVLRDAAEMATHARTARIAPEKFTAYAETRFSATSLAELLHAYIMCETCLNWITTRLDLSDGDIQSLR